MSTTTIFQNVIRGDIAAVESLLNSGVDINARDPEKLTPLFYAKTEKMANFLLERGADIEARCSVNYTPLLEIIFHSGDEEAGFYGSSFPIAKLLLDRGANCRVANSCGETACHLAVIKSDVKILNMLISKGFYFDTQDENGNTPLHNALIFFHDSRSCTEIVESLLNAGADKNIRNNDGKTPFELLQTSEEIIETDAYAGLEQLLNPGS